jgi:hypothetical protein
MYDRLPPREYDELREGAQAHLQYVKTIEDDRASLDWGSPTGWQGAVHEDLDCSWCADTGEITVPSTDGKRVKDEAGFALWLQGPKETMKVKCNHE